MSPAAWWTGVPRIDATIPCGPGHHTLRWEEGRVRALDHPDPVAEALLTELLDETPPCLTVIGHWADHAADPRLLAVGSRHPGDTLALGDDDVAALRPILARRPIGRPGSDPTSGPLTAPDSGGRRVAPLRPPPDPGRPGLLELLALPAGLQRRLQAEVVANLTGTGAQGPQGPSPNPGDDALDAVLAAATIGRLEPIARRWAGTAALDLAVGPPGVTAARGRVAVTVDGRWLGAVWGRYLGSVDGFLVLGVHRIVEDRAEVTGVGAPGGDPARLVLTGPAPWRVETRIDD